MIDFRSTIAALMGAVFVSMGSNAAASDCVVKRSASFESHRCLADRLWVIETRRALRPIYHPVNALTLRQLATADPNLALLVNGSYHDGDYGNAKLEGLFVVDGKSYAPLKSLDAQLSHVISFSDAGRISTISLADQNAPDAVRWTVGTHIQSGPLIIDSGRIATAFIDASINGHDRYKRTALGVTSDGATVIVIAKTPMSLREFASSVLTINRLLERRLTLLNFDGGPSSTLHSNEQRALSYQADKMTPIAFAIRR
jgi:uncharacterized protein YigE (DUF2233 family)